MNSSVRSQLGDVSRWGLWEKLFGQEPIRYGSGCPLEELLARARAWQLDRG